MGTKMSRYKTDEYRERHAAYAREWRKTHKSGNSERMKRWKQNNPEKYRAIQANSSLKKNYGITVEQRDQIFALQGSCFAICRSTDSGRKNSAWAVDHCHKTQKIRGVLCHPCNGVLGYARDNPETLAAAIKYLATHRGPTELHRLSWETSSSLFAGIEGQEAAE